MGVAARDGLIQSWRFTNKKISNQGIPNQNQLNPLFRKIKQQYQISGTAALLPAKRPNI
jgi:hypothetical protein